MTAILRGETTDRPGGFSVNSGATYSRRFLVRTTSIYDGPYTVVRCDGLPQFTEPYRTASGEEDPTAVVIDKRAVPRESPTEWYVDVDYGAFEEELIGGGDNDNPLSRPIEIGGSFAQHSKLVTRAFSVDSDAFEVIKNSAGDPYAAQEVDDSRPEIEITRNLQGFSLAVIPFYKDAVNQDRFLDVFPPGTLKMGYIGFRRQVWRGLVYTEVTQHIHYSESWLIELLDEGFNELVAGVKTRIEIPGAGGRLIYPSEPQLLDGSGSLLPDGRDPLYRRYRYYREVPFAPLLF